MFEIDACRSVPYMQCICDYSRRGLLELILHEKGTQFKYRTEAYINLVTKNVQQESLELVIEDFTPLSMSLRSAEPLHGSPRMVAHRNKN